MTTVCFTYEGALYVPARDGSSKSWPHYAVSNPSVRILVGGRIYPVRATRIEDESLLPAVLAAAAEKYDFLSADGEIPEDVWLFRMDSVAGVASR